jgi:hypothetical protein
MLTPDGSLMEPWQNMAKSMGGSEKSAILFAMFFHLGITTLSNIAIKLSFSEWAAGCQRFVAHELRSSSSSHGIACSGNGDGGDDSSNSYSGGGGDDDYIGGGVNGDNGGGGGGGGGGGDGDGGGDSNSDGGGHKQQTSIS